MKTGTLIIVGVIAIFAVFFVPVNGFSEDNFDIGRFSYFHYGEKFYQYKYYPFGTLASESSSRCYFTSDFVLDKNSFSEPGHVMYKFPNDMVWPGGYANSTFFVMSSPSFNFPEDNNFERIIPTKTEEGSIVLEFNLVPGLNTFLANSTAFWDSQKSQIIDCPNPFDYERQDYGYYDFVYPLKVQQDRAMIFDLDKGDFLCKPEFVLIKKYDGSPACVREQTAPKLTDKEERSGWNVSEQLWESLSKNMNEYYSDDNCPRHCLIFDEKYVVNGIEQTLGKTIGLPKLLPDGYDHFQFHHRDTYSVVQISPNSISLDTSWNDFYWEDNGIFLLFSETPVTVDGRTQTEYWAKNNDAQKLDLITSDEHVYIKERGIFYDDKLDILYPTFTEAKFNYGDLTITVTGYVSSEEMFRIVNSFFEK